MKKIDQPNTCKICGVKDDGISKSLEICVNCIRNQSKDSLKFINRAHISSRELYGLRTAPPKSSGGIKCNLCSNECEIGNGEKGFCGLKEVKDNKLFSLTNANEGVMYSYKDPHVTNCCAAWFCPGGTGVGYPKYSYSKGKSENGHSNLAVFLYGCNFDCLFCQNSSHKNIEEGEIISSKDFVNNIISDNSYSCICYFGGSPEPQLPFAINASNNIIDESRKNNRIVRICYEWNGCGNPKLVREAAETSLASGGNMKFDLKCFNPNLSLALSGVSNERAYQNFEMIANESIMKRSDLPLLTATTLLVPHYVDTEEVGAISKFISELDPDIPYSLLMFHPDYYMSDILITPKKQVSECFKIAKKNLKNVHLGNIHLLGANWLYV
jgi:pyruvate formate lyase activating enzyme